MNKKKIILTIITFILFLIVFFLSYLVFNKYVLKRNFEDNIISFANKNQQTIFEINKVALFSSCDAKSKNISSTNFNTPPSIGEPKLYFKSINNFSKSSIIDENIINDKLDFNITSDDKANLDTPTLYNNLANPITLSYVNSNIKSDYTITNTSSPITYDGSLLKTCNIALDSIKCNLSFDIYIINNLDQQFKSTVYIDIPLQKDEKTIYDGNITLKSDTNFKFYRYK